MRGSDVGKRGRALADVEADDKTEEELPEARE
jgi:hypothetical protein